MKFTDSLRDYSSDCTGWASKKVTQYIHRVHPNKSPLKI